MFGIGTPELLVILAVALIVIGPKKLPDLAKSLGRALGEFKRATSDLKHSIEQETGLDEVRKDFSGVKQDVLTSMDPTPASGVSTPTEGAEIDLSPVSPEAETDDSGISPDREVQGDHGDHGDRRDHRDDGPEDPISEPTSHQGPEDDDQGKTTA